MDTISILLTIVSLGLGVIKLFSGSGSGSGSTAKTPDDFYITANLTVDPKVIAHMNLEGGDPVTLESAENNDVNVIAKGSSWTPEVIGTITDFELHQKVQRRAATAKIFTVNGGVVTLEFKYAY